jgi:hypothetical protein
VQRFLARLLLVLFSFSLIGPAVLAGSESQLPACCRRLGQHHCDATQGVNQASGSSVQAGGQKCPFFPLGRAVPAHAKALFRGTAQSVVATLVGHPAGHVRTESRYRVSFSRSSQKRGPPVLLS